MYYTYTVIGGGVERIGHATSNNGIDWTKDKDHNPVLDVGAPGAWDSSMVWCPMVWKEGDQWYMIFSGGDRELNHRIGLARSNDGLIWTKEPTNPRISGSLAWELNGVSSSIENFGIMKVGTIYYLWYGNIGRTPREIGLATSTDLLNWNKDTINPIFGGTTYLTPFPFKSGGYYYLILGRPPLYLTLFRCENPTFYLNDREEVSWILKVGSKNTWDSETIETPCVLTEDVTRVIQPGSQLYMYYGGKNATDTWQNGLVRTSYDNLGWMHSFWGATSNIIVEKTTVWKGSRALRLTGGAQQLDSRFDYQFMGRKDTGVWGCWMQRNSLGDGNAEIYLKEGENLTIAVAMRDSGYFAYWDGTYHDTSVRYDVNTWYLLTAEFNCTRQKYNFVVYDATLKEIARVKGISFGRSTSAYLDRLILTTNSPYKGDAFFDNMRGRKYSSPEPTLTIE
jgi:predicted GH43/DUF377 family glycosyl hydrolase